MGIEYGLPALGDSQAGQSSRTNNPPRRSHPIPGSNSQSTDESKELEGPLESAGLAMQMHRATQRKAARERSEEQKKRIDQLRARHDSWFKKIENCHGSRVFTTEEGRAYEVASPLLDFLRREIVHELNNPLTGFAYLEVLRKQLEHAQNGGPLDLDRAISVIDNLRRSSRALGEVVATLGDFVTHGGEIPEYHDYDIRESTSNVVKEFISQAKLKKISLKFQSEIEEGVPFISDIRKFNRAIRNLIQNAIDSIHKQSQLKRDLFEGPELEIKMRFSKDQKWAVITFANLGEISKENAAKLFDFDKRALSTSSGGDGIGQQNILHSINAINGRVSLKDRGSLAEGKPVVIEIRIPVLDNKPLEETQKVKR